MECEKAAHIGARRSIVASCNIKKGKIITEDDIIELRPGIGISPTKNNIEKIMGKRLLKDINTNDLITKDLLSWNE